MFRRFLWLIVALVAVLIGALMAHINNNPEPTTRETELTELLEELRLMEDRDFMVTADGWVWQGHQTGGSICFDRWIGQFADTWPCLNTTSELRQYQIVEIVRQKEGNGRYASALYAFSNNTKLKPRPP